MDNAKVGVIGVGHLGVHRQIYQDPGGQLVGVVDINEGPIQCRPAGSNTASTMRPSSNRHPDALSIVVPTSYHFEVARSRWKTVSMS